MPTSPTSSKGSGVGSPRVVAATVAALGTGSAGKLGQIKVVAWPATEYVDLTYDADAGHWLGEPVELVAQGDQAYMGTNSATYNYLGTDTAGAVSGGIGWSTQPIRQAAALLAAGLSLQAVFSLIAQPSGLPSPITLMPRFFQHNSGEAVVFSADGSTAVGELAAAITSSQAGPALYSTGWVTVVKLSTSTPLAAADVSKTNLWPRLYAHIGSGASFAGAIDASLKYRWVG